MSEYDPWATSTGLLDDFDGLITDAHFATDAKYQNGEVLLLNLVLATDSDDVPEVTQKYSCGKGWESVDGGKTAKDESGNTRRLFNKQSAYGELIDRCVLPTDANGLDVGKVLRDRGTATEAKVWLGLRFHWKSETREFTMNGEKRSVTRLLPNAYLGEGPAEDAPKAEAPKSSPADKVAAAKAKAAAKANGNGGGLRDQLLTLARAHDTHESFVDAAMDVDGVVDDDALLAEVVDEGALYTEARA